MSAGLNNLTAFSGCRIGLAIFVEYPSERMENPEKEPTDQMTELTQQIDRGLKILEGFQM